MKDVLPISALGIDLCDQYERVCMIVDRSKTWWGVFYLVLRSDGSVKRIRPEALQVIEVGL